MNCLESISPIDGRYRAKAEKLAIYFSESALIRNRVRVEIEYYIALMKELGVETFPDVDDTRSDIIQTVCLGSEERMRRFCRGIQKDQFI